MKTPMYAAEYVFAGHPDKTYSAAYMGVVMVWSMFSPATPTNSAMRLLMHWYRQQATLKSALSLEWR